MNKDNKEAGKTKFESVDMLPIDVPAFLFPCKQIIEIIQKDVIENFSRVFTLNRLHLPDCCCCLLSIALL